MYQIAISNMSQNAKNMNKGTDFAIAILEEKSLTYYFSTTVMALQG